MTIRVVLVDDVPEVRRLVRTALRFRGGFAVLGEAEDGAEAVALAREVQPDVVVLDLGLPDLAGRDVLTGIRAGAPRARVVVFSGAEVSDRDWIAERVEGYVLKDADLDYLVDLLEAVGRDQQRQATLELPRRAASVSEARRFLRHVLAEWGTLRAVDDALVVVSELVTNAIMHAQSRCRLTVSADDSAVRIEVLDHGNGTPDPRSRSATEEHGRGLYLIAALTSAWGVEDVPGDGKVVWAELPTDAPPGPGNGAGNGGRSRVPLPH